MEFVYKRNISGKRLGYLVLLMIYPCLMLFSDLFWGRSSRFDVFLILLMACVFAIARRQRITIGEEGISFYAYSLPLLTRHRWDDIATIQYVRWGNKGRKNTIRGFLLMRKDGGRLIVPECDTLAASPAYVPVANGPSLALDDAIKRYWNGDIPHSGWLPISSYGQDLGPQAGRVAILALLLAVVALGLLVTTHALYLESTVRMPLCTLAGLIAAVASLFYQRQSTPPGKLLTSLLLGLVVPGFVFMATLATACWLGPRHEVRLHALETTDRVLHWQGSLGGHTLDLMVPYGHRLPDQTVEIRGGLLGQYVITSGEYRKLDPNW